MLYRRPKTFQLIEGESLTSAHRVSAPNLILVGTLDPYGAPCPSSISVPRDIPQPSYPASRKTVDLRTRTVGLFSADSKTQLWRLLVASAVDPEFWAKKRSDEGELSDRSRQLGGSQRITAPRRRYCGYSWR